MTTKLHQVIAIEKGVKTRSYKFVTDHYKSLQKAALFDGLTKTYEKKDEDGDDYPPERQLVKMRVDETLHEISEQMTEYMNIVATKDFANCSAKADVVVDGEVLLKGVPATHLLFLEKQLVDIATAIDALPVLDSAYDWRKDEATGLHKSEPTASTKTKKTAKPIVLYEATENHPAQTQLIQEDVSIGTWITVRQSGAATADEKKKLQKKARALLKAVKFAREEANSVEAPEKQVGEAVFNYLLG